MNCRRLRPWRAAWPGRPDPGARRFVVQTAQRGKSRLFGLFLIKPSHYDDEGYAPVAPMVDPGEHAGDAGRPRARLRRAAGARRGRRDPDHRPGRADIRIGPTRSSGRSARRAEGAWSGSSACRRTSIRAPWTSPGRSPPPGSRCASAGSTSAAAWRCCRTSRRNCAMRWISASRSSPVKRRDASRSCCRPPTAAS